MKFHFEGDTSGLMAGIKILGKELGFATSSDGRKINVVRGADNRLQASAHYNQLTIVYGKRIHFFRALGLLIEHLREETEFHIVEEPQFTMNGPMFDVSQGGAVMKVPTVKTFLRKMALMGLDMIMLYAEDSYDVKEQPYFGYMRGRYSQAEIGELDDYADLFGIELIPCIQTLSHLVDVLKWKAFEDIRDDYETMLVGYERTYEFIEQMIVAASSPVRSKRIHLGMDEAWMLGLGAYLAQNGFRSKFEIMNDHLQRVLKITEKYGLQPMMWSDMYFRASSASPEIGYDIDVDIRDEVIQTVPKGVQQVYWDYKHADEAFYRELIRKHKKFGSTPVFAGGIWCWRGFAVNYGATFVYTNAALNACKQEGVTEIIATLWGDDGTESDRFSTLLGLQLFAEHGYSGQLNTEKLKARFHFCTGAHYDDFMAIRLIDETPGVADNNLAILKTSRYLLWQNVMMGLFDKNIRGLALTDHYMDLEGKMEAYAARNGEFGCVFEMLRRLCRVLILKADLGNRIYDAYHSHDKRELADICDQVLPDLAGRVKELRLYQRERWHRMNKAFGWDVIDSRYGALLMSLDTAADRISGYLAAKVERLEELEEERLLFNGEEGLVDPYDYKYIVSASRIAV